MNAAFAFAAAIVLTAASMFADRLFPAGAAGWPAAWPSAHATQSRASVDAAPRWVVEPDIAGPDLPPAGRSTFDLLVTRRDGERGVYDVPFPFEALVDRIEAGAGCSGEADPCTRKVLIPLGRSLQRTAGAPDFFAHPRVVVAVDREGPNPDARGILLKDRLYLGYQERAGLIEVISYNEDAARFEFQLVKDYRPGATPKVLYANRDVCIACHQNHAPLFSRQQWDETNANPRVAALFGEAARSYHGVPARIGIGVPNAIDDATDRANLFAATQLLWQEGCGAREPEGPRCRAAVLTAAFQYRLTGERGFDEQAPAFRVDVVATLERNLRARAPGGLAIADPDIPNRDPLAFPAGSQGVAITHVPAALEPLAVRAPLEIWSADGPNTARRFVLGIAAFIADSDVRAIDAHLSAHARAGTASTRTVELPCEISAARGELGFRCESRNGNPPARVSGRAAVVGDRVGPGTLDAFAIGGAAQLLRLELGEGGLSRTDSTNAISFVPSSGGLTARMPDGRAVARIELRRGADGAGLGTITIVDDLGPLREAAAALARDQPGASPFAARAFSRKRVLFALSERLGAPAPIACCDGDVVLPPAEVEVDDSTGIDTAPAAAALARHCARCHRTPEPFPPNFLHGSAKRVTAAVTACAPRIFVRLGMWTRSPSTREKTPMPPLPRGGSRASGSEGPSPAVIASLQSAVGELVRAETGRAPDLDAMLVRGYESLPPCLPAGI